MNETCNISGNEVKLRLYTGYSGLILSIISLLAIFLWNINYLLILPFVFISSLGFIQAREKYCVYVGIIDLLKKPGENKEQIIHIFRSIFLSLLIAVIITAGVYLLTLTLT